MTPARWDPPILSPPWKCQLFLSPWRQQTTTKQCLEIYTLRHHHQAECFRFFIFGAYGFGKKTVGEGLLLLLSFVELHSRHWSMKYEGVLNTALNKVRITFKTLRTGEGGASIPLQVSRVIVVCKLATVLLHFFFPGFCPQSYTNS